MLLAAEHDVVGYDSSLYDECRLPPLEPTPIPAIRRDVRDACATTSRASTR